MLGRGASKAEPLLGILPPNSITGPFSLTICCFAAFVVAVLLVWTRFHKRSSAMLAEGMLGFRHVHGEDIPQPSYLFEWNGPELMANPVIADIASMDTNQLFQRRSYPKRAGEEVRLDGFDDKELRARQQYAWGGSGEEHRIGARRGARIAFRRSRGHGARGLGARLQDRRGVRPQAERGWRRARPGHRPVVEEGAQARPGAQSLACTD